MQADMCTRLQRTVARQLQFVVPKDQVNFSGFVSEGESLQDAFAAPLARIRSSWRERPNLRLEKSNVARLQICNAEPPRHVLARAGSRQTSGDGGFHFRLHKS